MTGIDEEINRINIRIKDTAAQINYLSGELAVYFKIQERLLKKKAEEAHNE